jgi:hypothetical protein
MGVSLLGEGCRWFSRYVWCEDDWDIDLPPRQWPSGASLWVKGGRNIVTPRWPSGDRCRGGRLWRLSFATSLLRVYTEDRQMLIDVELQVFGVAPDHAATSKLPQHGFARTSRWEFLGKSTSESSESKDSGDSSVKLDFGLSPSNLSDASKKAWPYNFGLIYSVTLGREGLTTSIVVRNEGEDAWDFQVLMHTYLRVKVSLNSRICSF